MSAAILWLFIVTFPVLMGAPVIVPVASVTEEQCQRVRKLMVTQLDNHRSNAAISKCYRAEMTIKEVSK